MVIPTVFVEKGESFEERFELVNSLSDCIQIDIMDGEFVEKRSMPIYDIPDLNQYNKKFEAHLMVKFPQNVIEDLAEKGFKKVIFHYESQPSDLDVKYLVAMIERFKMEPMVAINPETPAEAVAYLDTVKKVLVMGVHPGMENQYFIVDVYDKVSKLKELGFYVQVDGGVIPEIAYKLGTVGCDEVNSGSYISSNEDPKKAMQKLQKEFEKGKKEWESGKTSK